MYKYYTFLIENDALGIEFKNFAIYCMRDLGIPNDKIHDLWSDFLHSNYNTNNSHKWMDFLANKFSNNSGTNDIAKKVAEELARKRAAEAARRAAEEAARRRAAEAARRAAEEAARREAARKAAKLQKILKSPTGRLFDTNPLMKNFLKNIHKL